MDDTTTRPVATTDSPARSRISGFWYALGAVAGAGLIFRLYIVLIHRETASEVGGSVYVLAGDAFFYHWQGRAVGEGLGFVDPVTWRATGDTIPSAGHVPGYSAFLGLVSFVGADSVTAHRIASSVLGAAVIVLIGLIARRLAGDRAALIAAVIAAFYPQLWINDGMVLAEPASEFTVALVVLVAYRLWDRRDLLTGVILGATIALATLTRSEQVFLFPVLALPLIYFVGDTWKRRFQLLGAVAIAGAVVMAPWMFRTATSFERPVLLTTGTGGVLSAGSCDGAFYGRFIGYYYNCFEGKARGDESERDAQAREQALDYLEDHTTRLPLVLAARVGRVWGLFKPGQTTALDWSLEGRGRGASWMGLFAYYALMPLAIGGLVVLRKRRVPIWPLVSLAIVVTLAAITSFGVTRYRAPAEVAIVASAAVAVDALWRAWSRRRKPAPATDAPPAPAPAVEAPAHEP